MAGKICAFPWSRSSTGARQLPKPEASNGRSHVIREASGEEAAKVQDQFHRSLPPGILFGRIEVIHAPNLHSLAEAKAKALGTRATLDDFKPEWEQRENAEVRRQVFDVFEEESKKNPMPYPHVKCVQLAQATTRRTAENISKAGFAALGESEGPLGKGVYGTTNLRYIVETNASEESDRVILICYFLYYSALPMIRSNSESKKSQPDPARDKYDAFATLLEPSSPFRLIRRLNATPSECIAQMMAPPDQVLPGYLVTLVKEGTIEKSITPKKTFKLFKNVLDQCLSRAGQDSILEHALKAYLQTLPSDLDESLDDRTQMLMVIIERLSGAPSASQGAPPATPKRTSKILFAPSLLPAEPEVSNEVKKEVKEEKPKETPAEAPKDTEEERKKDELEQKRLKKEEEKIAKARADEAAALKRNQKQAKDKITEGAANEREGRPKTALACYEKAISLDPTNAEAYYKRGALKGLNENLDDAFKDFQECVKLDSSYILGHISLGKVHRLKGALDAALGCYNQAHQMDEENASVLRERGRCYILMEKPQSALDDFDESLRYDKDSEQGLIGRLEALFLLGRYEEALAVLDGHRKIMDKDPSWIVKKGEMYLKLEHWQVALEHYKTSHKKIDKLPDESLGLKVAFLKVAGVAHRQLKDYPHSTEALSKALKLNPDDATVIAELGLTAFANGDKPQARGHFEHALALKETNKAALEGRARLNLAEKKQDKAFEDFDKLKKLYLKESNFDAALKIVDECIGLNAATPQLWYARAEIEILRKNYEQAVKDYGVCLKANPKDMIALLGRGKIYVLQGKKDDALRDFDQCLAINPDDIPSLLERAKLHVLMEAKVKALQDYKSIVRLDPKHTAANAEVMKLESPFAS